jgi:hypothetical protein
VPTLVQVIASQIDRQPASALITLRHAGAACEHGFNRSFRQRFGMRLIVPCALHGCNTTISVSLLRMKYFVGKLVPIPQIFDKTTFG